MSTYQSRLLQRRAGFVERWLLRLKGTQASLAVLAGKSGSPDMLEQIGKDFHQLAGAAGIYELTEVCDLAVEADDLAASLIQRRQCPSPAEQLQLSNLLANIEQILKQVQTSTSGPQN